MRASIALFEGGLIRSRARQAKSVARQKEHEIAEAERQVIRLVTRDHATFLAAQAETAARVQQIETAQYALEGVREEAGQGQRSILDILDADAELIEAKAAHARAECDEVVAHYALAKTLGLLNLRAPQ